VASISGDPCPYCGLLPCVGDRCPQWDFADDDDFDDDCHRCARCGDWLRPHEMDLCWVCEEDAWLDDDAEDL
jgi:hypothetical protein